MRTTIHVFGMSRPGCSKAFTYSYLKAVNEVLVPVLGRRVLTWSWPFWGLGVELVGCSGKAVSWRCMELEARISWWVKNRY